MLYLKANSELKEIYTRLISTMGVPVKWNGVFVIVNHNMILAGDTRSFLFNYENKRAYYDILDLPPFGQDIGQIPDSPLLTNLFNMTLYVFSKWGCIKRVKVEKDYATLNNLFQNVLKEIRIESSFGHDKFRFSQDGKPITYEDVIEIALKAVIEPEVEIEEDFSLGLWHNVCWRIETISFDKQPKGDDETVKSRIGNNFYLVDYLCPSCREKIHMTVYPEGEDVLIETEEARVYLARAFTCSRCNSFYTPKPGKLLGEGEVYCLRFEDDRTAYEDYLERLGRQGTRTTSFRLNRYETKGISGTGDLTEDGSHEEDGGIETSPIQKPEGIGKKGRKVDTITLRYEKKADEKIDKKTDGGSIRTHHGQSNETKPSVPITYDFSTKTIDELKDILTGPDPDGADPYVPESVAGSKKEPRAPEYVMAVKSRLKDPLKAKYEARLKLSDRMTKRQLVDLKKQVEEDKGFLESDAHAYIDRIDEILTEKEMESINEKVETAKSKTYAEITRIIHEMERAEGLANERKDAVERLRILRSERGKQEVERLIRNMPVHTDRKKYKAYLERIKQYDDVDLTPYEQQLEHKRDLAEKEELASLVKSIEKKDRDELNDLYEQLNAHGFSKHNVTPYLNKVRDTIQEMDQKAIAKLCRDVSKLSFEDGLAVYGKINESMFLPELKKNTLDAIRRRLMKIKLDENIQLVKKLKKEMERNMKDLSRLYFYDAGRFQEQRDLEQNESETKTRVIENALHGYASVRSEFEFPLMVCDASRKGNGKRGFLLTPDHIFYRDFLNSGRIDVMDLEELKYQEGKLKKGIYAVRAEGEAKRLPNAVNREEKERFVETLNEFIHYLKDKPESRSIGYLAKEEHDVKCCYRCGHTYKGGSVCPKCGYKTNG